jgi:hypothetical protein
MNTELFAEAHQAKASHRINEGFFRKAQQAKASRFFRAFCGRKKSLRLCDFAFEIFAFAI